MGALWAKSTSTTHMLVALRVVEWVLLFTVCRLWPGSFVMLYLLRVGRSSRPHLMIDLGIGGFGMWRTCMPHEGCWLVWWDTLRTEEVNIWVCQDSFSTLSEMIVSTTTFLRLYFEMLILVHVQWHFTLPQRICIVHAQNRWLARLHTWSLIQKLCRDQAHLSLFGRFFTSSILASPHLVLLFIEDLLRVWFGKSWRCCWTLAILVDVLHLSVLLVYIMNCLFLLL